MELFVVLYLCLCAQPRFYLLYADFDKWLMAGGWFECFYSVYTLLGVVEYLSVANLSRILHQTTTDVQWAQIERENNCTVRLLSGNRFICCVF